MSPYRGTTSDVEGHWNNINFCHKHYSVHTLDYMSNLSEKVGYLDKTRHAGMYVVNKHFPSGYKVSQLRKDYDNNYVEKFYHVFYQNKYGNNEISGYDVRRKALAVF